jgi:hypothetical protein
MDSKEENLSPDEQRIAELIGTLRHVDAPGDFETHVRARIASGRDEKPRMFWRPVFAGVGGIAVLVFVGYLGFRSPTPNVPTNVAQTSTNDQPPVVQKQPSIIAPTPASSVAPQTPETAVANKPKGNKLLPPAQQGGSIDEAVHQSNVLVPKTYNPSQHRPNDTSGLGTAEIPVTMIFQAIGVHATWNGGWHVDSVEAKNVAGRSGVRSGDIIEALNGQPVTENTSFKGSFSGKSMRVQRNGSVIEIPFKP